MGWDTHTNTQSLDVHCQTSTDRGRLAVAALFNTSGLWFLQTANVTSSERGNVSLNTDLPFYQLMFGVSIVVLMMVCIIKCFCYIKVTLHASTTLHNSLLNKVTLHTSDKKNPADLRDPSSGPGPGPGPDKAAESVGFSCSESKVKGKHDELRSERIDEELHVSSSIIE